MAEYIEREAALAQMHEINITEVGYRHRCIDPQAIREIPAADVVPVRHGRWIEYPECLRFENAYSDDHIVCSECHEVFSILDNCTETFNYCPNCGAKMDMEYINEKEDNEDD